MTLLQIGTATQCGPETQKKTTQLDFALHITQGFPEEGKVLMPVRFSQVRALEY